MTEPETLEKPRYAVGERVIVEATIVRCDSATARIQFPSDGDEDEYTIVWLGDIKGPAK